MVLPSISMMLKLSRVLVLLGVFFFVVGIFAFNKINEMGEDWKKKKELVDSGSIPPVVAHISDKFTDSSGGPKNRYTSHYITIKSDYHEINVTRSVSQKEWNELKINQKIEVFVLDNDYYIPLTDTGGFSWASWVFLFIGATPFIAGVALYLLLAILK